MISLNDVQINVTMFPDKTSQVWKLPENCIKLANNVIHWSFENEGEFLHLAQLRDLLSNINNLELSLSYLPYGRQDKEVSNESTFALRTFAKLLNSLKFTKVTCIDPHSKVAKELINNFEPIYLVNNVNSVFSDLKSDLICYPDYGAVSKYQNMYFQDHAFAEKSRDQKTGNIVKYNLYGNVLDKKVLIVDDICDGGKTFIELTKLLKSNGVKEVNLFVSHGLFTNGLECLREVGINKIFTKYGEVK